MVQTTQLAKVTIEDEDGKKLDNGEYLGIEILFASPISVDVNFSGTSTRFDKQLLQITFPGSDGILVQGVNKDDQNNIQEVVGNTEVKIENIDTNSIKVVRVTSVNNTGWTPLHGINNPSTIVISRSKSGPDPGPDPGPVDGELLWNSSDVWNRNKRTIKGTDPEDDKLQVRAGGSYRKFEIDGKGTGTLTGHQVRLYINAHCYNVEMQVTYIHKEDLNNLSLRMRSLRNEFEKDEDNSKRFGGYGLIITKDGFKAEYQTSKEGDKVELSAKKLPNKIPDDKPVTIKWSVRDVDDKIEVKAWIKYDENSEFKEVINISNTKYEDIARDKKQFHKSGVVWIRINGDDEELGEDENKRAKHPNEIPIRDVKIIELKD